MAWSARHARELDCFGALAVTRSRQNNNAQRDSRWEDIAMFALQINAFVRPLNFLSLTMAAGLAATIIGAAAAPACAEEPITIGLSMALTGPLAANGKSALLGMQIWQDDVNAAGGLLGRPVKLVTYDDQSNPSTVPGIYTKLLDVDKVDLVVSGYATNMIAPAMPVVMGHGKVFIGLFGLAVNSAFHYSKYLSMTPGGPDTKASLTKGFFEVAMAQNPKPQTVAIVGANAEFSNNAMEGARQNAKAAGLNIIYDQSYPPATTDFSPIVRAIQAANPDLMVICSYPLDSAGMVRAINEIGYMPKMVGGGMVGPMSASMQTQLGPLLNGFVDFDFWLPAKTMQFPGAMSFLKRYQDKAPAAGVDPLGYYVAPWAYADLQVLADAVTATKSLDDNKLADYMHKTTFNTVIGDVTFGPEGEWAKSRVLQVQFHDIAGNGLEQFRDTDSVETVLTPADYKTGAVIYPYSAAKEAAPGR
jgi:branched-chain amino acid transport system substrate-binding protein